MPPGAWLLGIIHRTFSTAERTDRAAVLPRKNDNMNKAVKEQFCIAKFETFKGQGSSY